MLVSPMDGPVSALKSPQLFCSRGPFRLPTRNKAPFQPDTTPPSASFPRYGRKSAKSRSQVSMTDERRQLYELPLYRRDSIGSAYHVLTFEARGPLHTRAGQFAMVRSVTWGEAPLLPRPMS